MDHREAARITAVEKYLLGELPDAQREDFEEHFFSCAECCEQVRLGAMFQANARSLVQEAGSLETIPYDHRASWFGWNLGPAFGLAAAALTLVVGYQNLVQIPQLRQSGGAAVLSAAEATEVGAVRGGDEQTFSRKLPHVPIVVRHEWDDPYTGYTFDLEPRPGTTPVATGQIGAVSRDRDLLIEIRPATIDPGKYMMTVYGVRADGQKAAVARIPLTLTD